MKTRAGKTREGFTLIELLVVIAIIALLIGILLPSLQQARKSGQAVKCGANLADIGKAMSAYLADWNGTYPPAYIYTADSEGNYDFFNANPAHPFGYIHWSWYLYGRGAVDEKAFQCPGFMNGGAPRTNPGLAEGWESGQVDQNGQSGPNSTVQDAQAVRMAYTGNAAIFPRNKFSTELAQAEGSSSRINVFTQDTKIGDTGKTILITEFTDNWKAMAIGGGGGLLSKSHRPINPFYHIGSGTDEYAAPPNAPGFTYGTAPNFGLLTKSQIAEQSGLIEGSGVPETNCVGRHHPGGDAVSGGSANFLYADGHVERKGVATTLENREWGQRYYSLTGENKVGPPW